MQARRRHVNQSQSYYQQDHYPQTVEPSTYAVQEVAPESLDITMTCRDRTQEFMSTLKSMQARQSNGASHAHPNSPLRQRSEFTQAARKISRDIASTYSKLEKLAMLAKKKSLFDDKPVEIQELTYIIKEDVKSLNQQIAQLRQFARSDGSRRGKHVQTHSNNVVVALQSKLAHMSNEFKSVLDMRTENMKQQKSRREHFSDGAAANHASMPPAAFHKRGSSLLLQDDQAANRGGAVAIDMDAGMSHQAQMQLVDQTDEYLQSRADTMKSIESTVVELGSIFQQLAFMVKEQDEMVTRIDANVEDAQMNIEGAHSEILKYFQSVSSNRWLMVKIFGVLIVFFIIFVVFMA